MEKADQEATLAIDPSAVEDALKKLSDHPEPEVGFMLMRQNTLPAYNVQNAVDAEHALIVAHDVVLDAADNRCLQPMAEAAKAALGKETFNIVADAGYSNGEQVANCEAAGMMPHVPATRTVNPKGNGTLFQRTDFSYQPETDTYLCPAAKTLRRKAIRVAKKRIDYIVNESDCSACSLKPQCTGSAKRSLCRHLYEEALDRMQARVTPALMRLRRSTVEHPFSTIKYRIFGHPRLLLRGRNGARTEIGLAVMAYNLKRMMNVLGAIKLTQELQKS